MVLQKYFSVVKELKSVILDGVEWRRFSVGYVDKHI